MIGDPASMINLFSVQSILIVMVIRLCRPVACFISVFIYIDSSISLSLVSSGCKISLNSCRFRIRRLSRSVFFSYLELWKFDSGAGHIWLAFQFGASQFVQFRSFGLSFGLASYFCRHFLCIGSSLVSSSSV